MPVPAPDTEGSPKAGELPLQAKVVRALEANRFACEYQPILRTANQEIWAFEALARFTFDGESIAPNRVFDSLRQDKTLFFMLESRVKSYQIAHRPAGVRLFLNLDPHVCSEEYQAQHWLSSLSDHDDLVVEIIENTTLTNLDAIKGFMKGLIESGIGAALDDVGGANNLFSFDLLAHCHYLKLDRRWFERVSEHPSYRSLLQGLIDFARERGIHTVLEGIETKRDLSLAQALGVDFVQGFLFRDAFVNVKDGFTLAVPKRAEPVLDLALG